jgi:uncharacterized protein involved in exopolysaccharide biosynthesis
MTERDAEIGGVPSVSQTEYTLFRLLAALRAGWRLIVAAALVAGAIVATATSLSGRTWTARASLTPQQRKANAPAGLGGIAAQLGVGIGLGDGSQTVFFYAELIRSRELLREIVLAPYKSRTGASVSLTELLNARDGDESVRIDNAIRLLSQRMTVSADPKTNIVRIAISIRDAAVAQQVAAGIIQRVNRFNLEKRQSQARAERAFAERRVEETKRDMEASEDRVQAFMTKNRGFLGSSELKVQQDRLERDLSLRQRLYNTLSESFEQARLEEVRDTPVITVLESPEIPAQPDRRFLALKTLLALMSGGVAAALWSLSRVVFGSMISDDPDGWIALTGRRRRGSSPMNR